MNFYVRRTIAANEMHIRHIFIVKKTLKKINQDTVWINKNKNLSGSLQYG